MHRNSLTVVTTPHLIKEGKISGTHRVGSNVNPEPGLRNMLTKLRGVTEKVSNWLENLYP